MSANSSKPVIVLSFANDNDAYLRMVVRERKNIYQTLQDHHDKDYLQVEKAEHTSIEDLFDIFSRYRDRVAIFHYGGHAAGTHLQLEAGAGNAQTANAIGLAQLMGQQQRLQLVFLNGCATQGQVSRLLQAGVKAVIATTVPINDLKAVEFSEQFYRALAGQATIEQAFLTAKAFLTTKYGTAHDIKQHRGIRFPTTYAANELPWGLYSNDDAALKWQLPTLSHNKIIVRGGSTSTSDSKQPQLNIKIIQTLFSELANHSPEVGFLLKTARENKRMDIRVVRQTIVDSFPAPIGEQLRKLFAGTKIGVERLSQLVRTYDVAIQLISFTLLSQLWDAKYEHPNLDIPEELLVDFNGFFAMNANSYETFDYVTLMVAIEAIFGKANLPYFVHEFADLHNQLKTESPLYKAHLFMMEMKHELADGKVPANEIESFCLQAEEQLAMFIKNFAFLVKYKLVTIKNIEIIKERHTVPIYRHNKVILDRVTAGVLDDAINYNTFTDNQSVILLRTIDDVSDYLNLSPFIIDENALTGDEKSKLFFYAYQDYSSNYVYQFIDNQEDIITVSDLLYPKISEQMNKFQAAIFGKTAEATAAPALDQNDDEDDFVLFE